MDPRNEFKDPTHKPGGIKLLLNKLNTCLMTTKCLMQGYRYHILRTTYYSISYRRHYELISKFNIKSLILLRDSLLELEFYGDLVYKFERLLGRNYFFLFSLENPLNVTNAKAIT